MSNSEYEIFRDQWERDIQQLEAEFSNTRAEAEMFAADQSSDDLAMFQWLAKNDLFFLCNTILGFDRLVTGFHGHLCGWMKDTEDEQFREILLPRGHFKSTVATIGDSIRLVLPDVKGDSIYPGSLGTDIRLVIGHEAHVQAMRFLYAITANFMGNKWLHALFPEAIPNPKKQKINQSELELPRTKRHPEPTIDTMSVGMRGQGRHYNYLKLDDLIGDEARDSETKMEAAKLWFDNIQSFFSNFGVDKFDLIGTRWAPNDLYEHVHRIYGDKIRKYIRPVEERDAEGVPRAIFPEEFTPEKLEILKKNKIVFSAQYLNDPAAGAQEFSPEWKEFYSPGRTIREFVVPVKGNGIEDMMQRRVIAPNISLFTPMAAPEIVSAHDCDVIFLIDPAMSGDMGFIVSAMDSKRRIFLPETIKDALRPPQFVELLFEKVQFWNPRAVVIEEVLFSGLFKDWLPVEMIRRGIKFHIEMCRTKGQEKDSRVRQLTNYFSAHQIYAPATAYDFWEEYDFFGTGKKYHLLDALAQGPKYWLPGNRMRISQENREREQKRLEGRSPVTGYSRIR